MGEPARWDGKNDQWYQGYLVGIQCAINMTKHLVDDFENQRITAERMGEKPVVTLGDDDDRCFCEDCAGEQDREYHTQSTYSADAMREQIESAFRREFENGASGFVVCVDDEPYADTFREDPSLAWGAFLPILEADPSLANEEIRLVKMVEG